MAEARVSFHIGARTRTRARARARRARASARARARSSRVSCIMKKWFKQNSAAMCRCPRGSLSKE